MTTKDSMNKYGLLGRNANQMTIILNRIERQLGLSVLPLPEGLRKDDWAGIIMEDTIPQWSQFFPYKVTEIITPEDYKDGWFLIDRNLPEGSVILGIGDIDWQAYKADSRYEKFGILRYAIDIYSKEYALDDIALTATGTDMMSLFGAGLSVYLEWEFPNKARLVSVNGTKISRFRPFPLTIYLQHPGVHTIPATMMESFMKLAKADVATAIYQVLKYYDNMDFAMGSLALQLDTLQDWASRRDDIIRELDEAHVSTANDAYPLIMTV